VPQGVVRADGEDFQVAVGVGADVDLPDPAAQGLPAAPGAGQRLRHVPGGVVGADGEHLDPAVGVAGGLDLADEAAEVLQGRPGLAEDGDSAAARVHLLLDVQRVVGADLEQLQPAVGLQGRRHLVGARPEAAVR